MQQNSIYRLLVACLAIGALLGAIACSRTEATPIVAGEAPVRRSTAFPELPAPLVSPTIAPTSTPRPVEKPSTRLVVPGQVLYVHDGQIYLWWRGESKKLTVDARNNGPTWLPDGRSFIFARWSQGFSDLYRYFLDGRPVEQLTRNDPIHGGRGAWATQPVAAPNGRQVAYVSDRGTPLPALWTLEVGNRAIRQIASDPIGISGIQDPAWRPDGSGLLGVLSEGGKSQVWSFQTAAGRWTKITSAADGAYAPAWHPDGEWIAYTERRGTNHDIWISRPDGRDATQLTTDGRSRSPVWAGDGSVLLFVTRYDFVYELAGARVELNGGSPRLGVVQQLTRGAGVDPAGGLSWNERDS